MLTTMKTFLIGTLWFSSLLLPIQATAKESKVDLLTAETGISSVPESIITGSRNLVITEQPVCQFVYRYELVCGDCGDCGECDSCEGTPAPVAAVTPAPVAGNEVSIVSKAAGTSLPVHCANTALSPAAVQVSSRPPRPPTRCVKTLLSTVNPPLLSMVLPASSTAGMLVYMLALPSLGI
jgi:hypothetical protein